MLRVDKTYNNTFIPQNGNILIWDVYYSINNKKEKMYSCPLLPLNQNELNLDDGRFYNFNKKQLKHKILINVRCPGIQLVSNLKSDIPKILKLTEECVEVISKNIKGLWNLKFEFSNVDDGVCIFSFENINDAMMFKLFVSGKYES